MVAIASRRSFLKAGLFGTLALVSAGALYRATLPRQLPHKFTLDSASRSVLAAIIPVMLKDAVTTASDIELAVGRVHGAIAGLPIAMQKELQDLFGLLALGPSRRFLVGLSDDWPQARQEDISAFLQNWRTSRFILLQSAYHALHDLITGSWYADESTWASIGYPGPLKELS